MVQAIFDLACRPLAIVEHQFGPQADLLLHDVDIVKGGDDAAYADGDADSFTSVGDILATE
jgi:hypothetical protein